MDKKLIAEARARLYSGVISDVLDGLGNMHHAMAPNLRPLDESLVLFGRARTGLYMPVYHVEPGINPYEHEIALVDDLKPDDVAVFACPPGNRIGPLDSKGRGMVMTINVPVECGGVRVAPGDWIFGDIDGVCVIPADLAERTITLALEKVAHETTVREELAAGELLRTVFARHQIL